MQPTTLLLALLVGLSLSAGAGAQGGAGGGGDASSPPPAAGQAPSMAEQYRARLPQEVEVSRLLGLAVIDAEENVLGHVREVIRMDDGTIHIVFDYLSFFGRGGRHVPVPLEAVAVVGQRLAVMGMPVEVLAKRKTWYGSGGSALQPGEKVAVALTKF